MPIYDQWFDLMELSTNRSLSKYEWRKSPQVGGVPLKQITSNAVENGWWKPAARLLIGGECGVPKHKREPNAQDKDDGLS